jgi:hypothetical protein
MKTKPKMASEIPRKATCGAGPVAGEKISGAFLRKEGERYGNLSRVSTMPQKAIYQE